MTLELVLVGILVNVPSLPTLAGTSNELTASLVSQFAILESPARSASSVISMFQTLNPE
jgi:hypothetical protein